MAVTAPRPRKSIPHRVARMVVLGALVLGFVTVLFQRDAIDVVAITEWIERHAWWETTLAFLGLHIVASLFFIPRLFLGVAAGAIFGAWWGTLLAVGGATLGGLVGFLAVRFVSADAVRLAEAPWIGPWLEKAEAQDWRLVLVARLVPFFPHTLINYVFGVSRVSTAGYMIGSALGMLPTTVIYVNLGVNGKDLVAGSGDWALLIVWGLGLIFVSWLVPRLLRRFYPDL